MNAAFKVSRSATPPIIADPRDRRGPFRPEKLISPRVRRGGAMSIRVFRAIDIAALLLTGAASLAPVLRPDWRHAPLGNVLPFAAPVLLTLFLMGALNLYNFSRRETMGLHAARLALVLAPGFAAGLGLTLLSPDHAAAAAVTRWTAGAAVMLPGLHILWWSLIWRWRRQGRLTPNVVIVGATTCST